MGILYMHMLLMNMYDVCFVFTFQWFALMQSEGFVVPTGDVTGDELTWHSYALV